MEIWKDVPNYEKIYQVSNLGNVRRNGKCLSARLSKQGYPLVTLSKHGKTKSYYVHRLVAGAFISNPYGLRCIDHKDEIRTNNRVENLEWCTYAYNNGYGSRRLKEIRAKSRAVEQRKNGILVRVWSSTKEAERNGFRSGCISLCCNGKRHSHEGYEWQWSL